MTTSKYKMLRPAGRLWSLADPVAVNVLVESSAGAGGAAGTGVERLVKEKVALSAEYLIKSCQEASPETLLTLEQVGHLWSLDSLSAENE